MNGAQPSIAEVAALVGNPARANILSILLGGRALTATELAYIGGYRRKPRVGTSAS
jgi:hypothetical protein